MTEREERNPNERPIWINPDRMEAITSELTLSESGALMDMLMIWALGDHEPLKDDWKWIASRLNAPDMHKTRHMTPARWKRLRPIVERYFVKLPDGRFSPPPDLVAINDPNEESVT